MDLFTVHSQPFQTCHEIALDLNSHKSMCSQYLPTCWAHCREQCDSVYCERPLESSYIPSVMRHSGVKPNQPLDLSLTLCFYISSTPRTDPAIESISKGNNPQRLSYWSSECNDSFSACWPCLLVTVLLYRFCLRWLATYWNHWGPLHRRNPPWSLLWLPADNWSYALSLRPYLVSWS